MRSLSKKANSKVHLLISFVLPHKITDGRFLLEKLKKLAKIQTLQFPIIINLYESTKRFDRFLNSYPKFFVQI